MKQLSDILQESILDGDVKVTKDTMKQVAREWMKFAAKVYDKPCQEGEDKDYYIDDEGHIHIIGGCSKLIFTSKHGTLKKLNPYVKIVELSPTSFSCTIEITDADVAMSILPVSQWGGGFGNNLFEVVYRTKQNLQPKHFPMMVHGNIRIVEAGNINFSIMPDCTREFTIDSTKCGTIKWPAGFPNSIKQITIKR